jgi:transcriptional regulator with XRE-family HTH domain
MHSFFDCLREERERLGFNQEAFGAIGGVKRVAQGKYEKGERFPDIGYLGAIAKVGADVQYITTGVRSSALSGDEALLLEGFRLMDSETKRRTLAMVYGGTPPAAPTTNINANRIDTSIGTNTAPITITNKGKK